MWLKRHRRRIRYLFGNICTFLNHPSRLGAMYLAPTMIIWQSDGKQRALKRNVFTLRWFRYLYWKLDLSPLLWCGLRYLYRKLDSGLPLLSFFSVGGTRPWL